MLPPSAVASRETSGRPLPEIIVLGEHTTYEVRYDGDGIVTGAKLLADPAISSTCGAEIAALWRQGEDLADFLSRTDVLTESRESS